MSEKKRPGRKPMFKSDEERRAYYREYRRKWAQAHPEKQRIYHKNFYRKHTQERIAAVREWRKNNPDYWVNPAINRLKRSGYTILLNGKEV